MEMKRTISGMIGKGSIAHNERKFIAENVDAARTIRNVVLQSENVRTSIMNYLMKQSNGITQNRNGKTGKLKIIMSTSELGNRRKFSTKQSSRLEIRMIPDV